jgi:putative DNA primase/helicase
VSLDEAIDQACRNVGIHPPKRIAYGKWLNTDTLAGKRGKGDGRLIVNDHCITAWNWQTGLKSTVSLRDGFSERQQQAVAQSVARAKAKAARDAARAIQAAESLIASASLSTHSYLASRGFHGEKALVVDAAAVREVVGDYIVPTAAQRAVLVPARRAGKVTSAQLIWEDGTKKFLFGGEIGGASHRLSTGVYTWLCEGYATGLSVRSALKGLRVQATVLCCFSAHNVSVVARHLQGRVFIAADNDKPLEQFGGLGTGEHYARETGLPYGMPVRTGTDFNDMHQQEGIFAVQRILTSVMARRSAG